MARRISLEPRLTIEELEGRYRNTKIRWSAAREGTSRRPPGRAQRAAGADRGVGGLSHRLACASRPSPPRLPACCLIALLPCCLVALLPCCLIALLPCCLVACKDYVTHAVALSATLRAAVPVNAATSVGGRLPSVRGTVPCRGEFKTSPPNLQLYDATAYYWRYQHTGDRVVPLSSWERD